MRKIYALIALMLLAVCPKAMAQEEENPTQEKTIAWYVPAEYYSEALDSVFESKIEAYTDGSYAIKGVYGSDKDIEFTIDNESIVELEGENGEKYTAPEIEFSNYYSTQATYYYFYAGDYKLCVYYSKGAGYAVWEGDTDEPGVWFYTYLYDNDNNYLGCGYDYITWNKADIVVLQKEIAWSASANYYSEAIDKSFESKIEAYTDGSYAIKGVYGSEYDIEFTIDNESVTDGVPEIVLTNYYSAQAPYYYFGAGDYIICAYYEKGSGSTAWEGDTDEPGIWFYTYLYDKDNNYLGGGYDYITWDKSAVTGISAIKQNATSDRIFSISGIEYTNKANLPAGLYIKNGKKFIVK